MTKKENNLILKLILTFILLQPIFDLISYFGMRGYIINISTYIKPLVIIFLFIYSFFKYNLKKKLWIIYAVVFLVLLIGHFGILYQLNFNQNVLLHELRYVINIIYMIAFYQSVHTLYQYSTDQTNFCLQIKKVITYTFILYFILIIIAVITNTSGLTYEYSDLTKVGFKGWNDSGQIIGHAFSIMLPIILYYILNINNNNILKVIFFIIIFIVISLLGTKVPFYISIIVLCLYVICGFFDKKYKYNIFNLILCIITVTSLVLFYNYTPVYKNTIINKSVKDVDVEKYDLKEINGSNNIDNKSIDKKTDNKYTKINKNKYKNICEKSTIYLEQLYKSGKLHPSELRKKQLYYNYKKYSLAPIKYKVFGYGYINQGDALSIESDLLMSIFSFGILGFICFLIIPIKYLVNCIILFLKKIKYIELERCLTFMSLGIFFCISLVVGCTYIYTNVSIFLVLLFILLEEKIQDIKECTLKNNKISFISLHLGYGGIESSIINTANALSKKYEVEIVSLYNLKENQTNKINKKVKVIYLGVPSPNKSEFVSAIKNKKPLNVIKEATKSLIILFLKQKKITSFIKNSDSKYIVSTRIEFSILLNKYGKNNTIKIVQEHCVRKDKKYLYQLKSLKRINYLCALTTPLESNYKKILKSNHYTSVILLPNMLEIIPIKSSKLCYNSLITISRLDKGKRIDEIINIFSKLKNVKKLYIIGDGKEYSNLEQQISNLNLENKIELLGYKNKKDITAYLMKSDIFLMTSISEGLPMVLLEASSYGLPCIAYETFSGTKDIIINNYNGFVISKRNEKEYVDAVDKLITNKDLKIKMGKNSKKIAYKYSKNEILKLWYKILDN